MTDIDEATGVPEPARVESWLRTVIGFEDARVLTVAPLTDGLSNVTCRVKLTDGPVAVAVLRIQPTRGIFEPYDILREGKVLNHLAGTAVPVPSVLASETDPRFSGRPSSCLNPSTHNTCLRRRPTSPRSPPTFPPSPRRSPRSTRSTGGRRVWTSSAYRVRPPKDSGASSKLLPGACRRSGAPEGLLEKNRSINTIYASNDLDEEQDFLSVIDAIQGEEFNPLWHQVLIVFNQGFTPHQFVSEDQVLAAAAGANPEITLVSTDEVYRCSIVGSK